MPVHWLATGILAVALVPRTLAACSSFEVVNQTYCERDICFEIPYRFETGVNTYRIGNGLICTNATTSSQCGPDNAACELTITNGTYVSATATWNVSQHVTREDAVAVFALAGAALGIPFPTCAYTRFGDRGAETENVCIPKGGSAWLEFAPEYNCVQGILACDADDSIPSGTAVELCAPAYVPGSNTTELAGDIEVILTSPGIASTLTTLEPTPTPIQGFPVSQPLPVTSPYSASVTPIPLRFRAVH